MSDSRSLGAAALAVGLFAAGLTASAQVPRPPITSRPAYGGNYREADRTSIEGIVIHKAEGDDASSWFESPEAGTSAHYDVHYDGSIYQSVADRDIAWHAGNGEVNATMIGIEHSGYISRDDVTEEEYRASARLTAWLCVHYGIPIDRQHIIGHDEVPDPNHDGEYGGASHHTDPGPYWDWDHYMALVRDFAKGGEPGPVTPPEPKPPAPKPPAPDPSSPDGGSGTCTQADGSILDALDDLGSTKHVLRRGSSGDDVAALQELLGFDPDDCDGVFGPRTEAAVRTFQKKHGLAPDGKVGAATRKALEGLRKVCR